MYDPKFSQKQMYDQYGSSRKTTTTNANKQFAETMKSSGGGKNMSGIGAKPPSFQDNNPNRDEAENKSTVAKVYENVVEKFKSFGAKEPEALIVDGKRVYQGPAFRGYDPTTRIGEFGGEYGKKNYFLGVEKFGIQTYPRTDVSPTLPPSTINAFGVNRDNPRLNMFGVNRGFTGGPEGLQAAPTMTQPAVPATASSAAMTAGINRILKEVVAPSSKEYKIKKGDTLSSIAVREGVTVDDLVKINSIEDKNKIYAGDTIIIPKPEEVEQAKEFVLRVSTRGDEMKRFEGEVDLTDPQRQFYQSTIPMDQRGFEPELGADAQSVTGYDDVPQMVRGLMSKSNIVKEDFDTSDVTSDRVSYKSVEKVQKRLNDLGYTTLIGDLAVDGVLGKGTARQLRKFQATAGLPPTAAAGQPVDEATQKALKNNTFNNKEGKDLTSTVTPLQDGLFEIIKAPIAKIESGGEAEPYAAIGGENDAYDGKYQLGKDAKDTIKNMRDEDGKLIFTTAERNKLKHPSNRADYRGDSVLQEKAFRQLTEFNHSELTKNSAKYRAMDQANQLAVLGYAHNQGAEAALEWLTTAVVGTDAFGTGGDEYSEAITEIFTKDDMLG